MIPEGGLAWLFPALAVVVWVGVPIYAALARGRFYAIFSAVLLTFALPAALILHARLRLVVPDALTTPIDLAFAYSMAAAGVQFAHLVRARMRTSLFRWAVSVPGQTFIAAGMLAGPWLLVMLPFRLAFDAFGWTALLGAWTLVEALPLAVALASILTSVATRPETVRFELSSRGPEQMRRLPVERIHGEVPTPPVQRPLRIVQLTDTHLGPWQSVARLRWRVEDLVGRDPDLVALTGDFLTMESMGTPWVQARVSSVGP